MRISVDSLPAPSLASPLVASTQTKQLNNLMQRITSQPAPAVLSPAESVLLRMLSASTVEFCDLWTRVCADLTDTAAPISSACPAGYDSKEFEAMRASGYESVSDQLNQDSGKDWQAIKAELLAKLQTLPAADMEVYSAVIFGPLQQFTSLEQVNVKFFQWLIFNAVESSNLGALRAACIAHGPRCAFDDASCVSACPTCNSSTRTAACGICTWLGSNDHMSSA